MIGTLPAENAIGSWERRRCEPKGAQEIEQSSFDQHLSAGIGGADRQSKRMIIYQQNWLLSCFIRKETTNKLYI
jgi:hypothetical protein